MERLLQQPCILKANQGYIITTQTYEYVYQVVGMKILFSGGVFICVSSSSANKSYIPE